MPWSNDQKQLAAMAARDAKLGDEHRRLLLRQLGKHVIGADGEPTSTAVGLTNWDLDVYLGLVEGVSPTGAILGKRAGHFQAKALDRYTRVRAKVRAMWRQAEARALVYGEADGLDRFLRGRVKTASDRNATLETADWGELNALITILHAMARQHGVRMD